MTTHSKDFFTGSFYSKGQKVLVGQEEEEFVVCREVEEVLKVGENGFVEEASGVVVYYV